jgi:hypothetical protein
MVLGMVCLRRVFQQGVPIRCACRVCLLRAERPESWQVVEALATHREQRAAADSDALVQHNIVTFLLKHARLADTLPGITAEDITRAEDVLDVNAFEIRGPEHSIRGLYPVTAMMNSSCRPNTQNSIDSDWVCRVRAVRPIAKGEEITDTYTYTLSNTLYRRKQLRNTKYFDCCCARCSDPTELGSHLSTLLCRVPACGGYSLARAPLEGSSPWTCRRCEAELPAAEVAEEQQQWEARLEAAPQELTVQEGLLAELGHLFHPGHNLATDVMFNLLPLLGARGSADLPAEAERKAELAESLLGTMDLIVPGQFRMRGMLLVERYTARTFLLRAGLAAGSLSRAQFLRRLAALRPGLAEAAAILGREPPASLEGSRHLQARRFLAQLDTALETPAEAEAEAKA